MNDTLKPAIVSLLAYCRQQNWAGYDPYDGLNSRLFQATPFRHSAWARLALIQVMKRSPINLRPLLCVSREVNPKGLALFTSAAIKLARLGLAEETLPRVLADGLLKLRSPGIASLCWGYPFDWQNRHFMLPRYHPNIICSTFGGHSLLDLHEAQKAPADLQAAKSVGDFILTGLNRSAAGDTFCFSYTPLDQGKVHNANLLGAAFLARLWQKTGDDTLQDAALRSGKYSVDRQRPDGSWFYGESTKQQWVDGFHTGYNLVALHRLHRAFDRPWLRSALERGYAYYRKHFFAPGGIAKYYHNRAYPLDIHSTAQGIITLVGLAEYDSQALDRARELFLWAYHEMRSPEGFYYFQKHRWWTVRTPYMRWSQAWMLLAMASLAEAARVQTPVGSELQIAGGLESAPRL